MNTDRFKFRVPYFKSDKFAGYAYRALVYSHIEWVKDDWADWVSKSDVLNPGINEQCTGVKDKNGNLIYENDRIKVLNELGTIRFGFYRKTDEHFPDSIYGYYIDWDKENPFRQDFGFWVTEGIEIIGNIHTTDKDK